MANQPNSLRTHDRWIAIVMWIALLAALVYTSGYATFLGFGGSITSFFQRLMTMNQSGQVGSGLVFSAVTLVAMVILVSQIIIAWRRFAALTNDLIASYARSDGSAGSPFFDLLIWNTADSTNDEDSEDEPDTALNPDQADNTSVSEVLSPLGLVWIVILLTPPVLSLVAVFFTPTTGY